MRGRLQLRPHMRDRLHKKASVLIVTLSSPHVPVGSLAVRMAVEQSHLVR